jgi:hypothetical protein
MAFPSGRQLTPSIETKQTAPAANVKPIVLSEGALSANHARYLNIM